MFNCSLLFSLIFLITYSARCAEIAVPDDFLTATGNAAIWKTKLENKVTAEFRNTPIHDALRQLLHESSVNYKIEGGVNLQNKSEQIITCSFEEVSLREALYIFYQKTGSKISWDSSESNPPMRIKVIIH